MLKETTVDGLCDTIKAYLNQGCSNPEYRGDLSLYVVPGDDALRRIFTDKEPELVIRVRCVPPERARVLRDEDLNVPPG